MNKGAKILIGKSGTSDTDNAIFIRQMPPLRKLIKRWIEFTGGKVAAGAKNNGSKIILFFLHYCARLWFFTEGVSPELISQCRNDPVG